MEYTLLGDYNLFQQWDKTIHRWIKGDRVLSRGKTLKWLKTKKYPVKSKGYNFKPFGEKGNFKWDADNKVVWQKDNGGSWLMAIPPKTQNDFSLFD